MRLFQLVRCLTIFIGTLGAVCIIGCDALSGGDESAAYERDRDGVDSRSAGGAAQSPAPLASISSDEVAIGDSTAKAAVPPKQERKRVYTGYAQLVVNDLEETKSQIEQIAVESEGYVEWIRDSTVSIRVPAGSFEDIFALVLGLGQVEQQTTATYDVTEAFQDYVSRLSIARKTRERLYGLLDRTDDLEERLKILQEIRRLTEQIENLEQTLESIKRHVAFSRIQVDLFERLARDYEDRSTIPFRWIADLHPLYASLTKLKGKISFDPGNRFAVFDGEEFFAAESADGVRIRITSKKNDPKGDEMFWQNALRYHLQSYYATAEHVNFPEEKSALRGILFLSRDREPFRYLVAVRAKGSKLFVVEVFYPNEDVYEEMRGLVTEALTNLGIKR